MILITPVMLATLAAPPPALAQSPGRLSDKQVEATMKQVADGLDRFVDQMDPRVRKAVIKNERGEVDVKAFLDDLRKASDAMRSRFDPPRYSANAEVLAFLTQARRLDDGIGRRPGMSGADPAWEVVKPSLARLGGAYGVDWSTEPGAWAAARTSDDEVKTALRGLEKNAQGLRKELEKDLKKDKSLDAAGRAEAIAPAIELATTAKQAASAFASEADIGPLVGKLLGSARRLEEVVTARKLTGPASSLWAGASADVGKVAGAYGVKP
jgi:hypothetical protein